MSEPRTGPKTFFRNRVEKVEREAWLEANKKIASKPILTKKETFKM